MEINIIGGGSAGIFAAALLSTKHRVTIYEKGKRLGRKFLVAGNGGFNLTHDTQGEKLVEKYRPKAFLADALSSFDSVFFRKKLQEWGVETFVGTSGRVFPKQGIKPVDVLNVLLKILEKNQVKILYHHEFIGFNEGVFPVFSHQGKTYTARGDKFVFALGGASWSKTGSDGKWLPLFENIGVKTVPFQVSNCGVNVAWNQDFLEKFEGTPLKNIAVSVRESYQKGEALITKYGLEGNAIYPLVHEVRKTLDLGKKPVLTFDLKPHSSPSTLLQKTARLKTKNYAYAFRLSPVKLALAKHFTEKDSYINARLFAQKLKELDIPLLGLRPIDEGISTVGGIATHAVNRDFSLLQYPHIHLIGEMLDWDAPTGGFLLQGCFSMARQLQRFLEEN